ncbi:FadR/GntR family transcriptional regulator [Siculibacillus lacustris]|nr:FCD domain-containing protein [Siculibacillus lacustris]
MTRALPEGGGRAARRGIERDKLHVSVVQALEAQVLSGALKVGERLPSEAEIARIHNVSTRSVREALQILETKGFVRRRHGERAMVVRDDVDEFLGSLAVTVKQLFADRPDYLVQLMDVRRILESEVVLRLATLGRPIREVEAALAQMATAATAGDQSAFTDGDAAFHLALVRAVGNQILNVLYDNLFSIIVDIIRVSSRVPPKSLAEGFAEHEDIYRLIIRGDAAGAVAAIRDQIDRSSDYLGVILANAALQRRESNR